MSATTQVETEPQGTPTPPVPEVVQEAEQAVIDRTPKDLQASAEQVKQSFNAFEQDEAAKATAAIPGEQAAQYSKDPGVETAAEELKVGNFTGVAAAAPTVLKEVKAGYKTTEFWITVAGVVLTQLGTFKLPGKYGEALTTAALFGSYVLSRGLAKH